VAIVFKNVFKVFGFDRTFLERPRERVPEGVTPPMDPPPIFPMPPFVIVDEPPIAFSIWFCAFSIRVCLSTIFLQAEFGEPIPQALQSKGLLRESFVKKILAACDRLQRNFAFKLMLAQIESLRSIQVISVRSQNLSANELENAIAKSFLCGESE
jgi:hypothetical protein